MKTFKIIVSLILISTFYSFGTIVDCGCSVPIIGAPGDHGTYHYQGDGDCCSPIGPLASFQLYHFGEELPYATHQVPINAAANRCHNC
jgi:hypothetical protein